MQLSAGWDTACVQQTVSEASTWRAAIFPTYTFGKDKAEIKARLMHVALIRY